MNEPLDESAAGTGAALFDEKSFYLEEFYGKSLLFALIPPSGERLCELDSLVRTLRELRRNQTRCIVIVSADALARIMRRLGRLAPRAEPPVFNPGAGLRSRPYPPDSAVARIWRALQRGIDRGGGGRYQQAARLHRLRRRAGEPLARLQAHPARPPGRPDRQ